MTKLIVPALNDVAMAVEQMGSESLLRLCGNSFTPFVSIINALEDQLCTLAQSLANVRSLLDCPEWYPIYQYTAHTGMCYYSSTGFLWAASTQIVMVIFSMVILTLRVSYYELDEVADDGSGKCTSNWCCCVEVVEDPDETYGSDPGEEEEENSNESSEVEEGSSGQDDDTDGDDDDDKKNKEEKG
jgi:hypothetical protein